MESLYCLEAFYPFKFQLSGKSCQWERKRKCLNWFEMVGLTKNRKFMSWAFRNIKCMKI